MKDSKRQKPVLFLAALIFVIAASFGYANAMSFDIGEEASLDVDVQLIYSGGIRVEAPEPTRLADINADDGNRNFDKWDLVNNRFSTVIDTELAYKNFGLVVRGKAFYDFAYMGNHSNNNPNTYNPYVGGLLGISEAIDPNEFSDACKEVHGSNVELLDYFAAINFELGGTYWDLRVGSLAVAWGEGLYKVGITYGINKGDIAALSTPGTLSKEIYLPEEQIVLEATLTDNLLVGGYYKFGWEHHLFWQPGAYMSGNDFYLDPDDGEKIFLFAPGFGVPVGSIDPDDDNQFGLRLMYRTGPWLNNTEIGLYYISYHDLNTWSLQFNPTFTRADWVFFDDLVTYAASFNTTVGDTMYSGELTYQADFPVAKAGGGWDDDHGIMQAQVAFQRLIPMPTSIRWLVNSLDVLGEVAYQWVTGLDQNELAGEKDALGASFAAYPRHPEIFRGIDMSTIFSYNIAPDGTCRFGNHSEGNDSLRVGFQFNIYKRHLLTIGYNMYFSETDTGSVDKDYVNWYYRYAF